LAIAERHGADVTVQCEAIKIEPSPIGYRVSFINHGAGGQQGETEAPRVFVCGGAVNSTELLLRCRDEYKCLPNLSDRLGRGYSGNGDFLAFAFDSADAIKPCEGPTITTGLVFDSSHDGLRNWFILEEGGYPKEIGGLLQVLNPGAGSLNKNPMLGFDRLRDELLRLAKGKVDDGGGSDHTMVFLAMGRDSSNGIIELNSLTHALKIKWDTPANLPLYSLESRLIADVAAALHGKPVENPFWHLLHIPVTVHNLGGCVMADSTNGGVTNADGEVHGYPGLYVLDGSILPAATGVNPSHTIAAVAERNIEVAIRKLKGEPGWRAPERAEATPLIDPVSKITIPAGGTTPPQTPAIGIKFTETMKGFVVKGWQPADDYNGADRAGQRADTVMDFTLTIATDNLDKFLADPNHTAIANGTVRVDPLTGPDGAPVTNGIFNLFVQGDEMFQRKMLYALPFTGADGHPYLLDGFKDVRDHSHFDVWGATSTLYTVIREGHSHDGAIIATGIVHILMRDFMHQLTTFRVTGTNSASEKIAALERFGKAFFGTLWDVFVRPYFQERPVAN
ncbi:MAG: GMC family oxidoreductase, partial [Candidatus Binataceae bacterium]